MLPVCPIHLNLKQVFFCLECDELLCRRCMMDNHRLHNYDETEAITNKRSAAVSDLLGPAEAILANGKEIDFSCLKEKLGAYHKELKMTLKSHFEKIHKHLGDREAYLLTCLECMIEKEYKKIEDAEKDFILLASKLKNTIANAKKKMMEEPKSISMITEGKQLSCDLEKDIESMNSMCTHITTKGEHVKLIFKEDDSMMLKRDIDKLGALFDANEDDVFTQNQASGRPRSLSRNISLPVLSLHPKTFTDDTESNSSISTVQPAAIISCTEKGKKFYPCGIAVGNNNLITVSDLHNNFVKVLTSTGKVIDTIESSKGSNAFKGPCALYVDKSDDIFILERDSKSIRKYTNGSLLDLGRFNKQFNDPRGILVLNEKVYVTDWKNNCIHILSLTNNKLNYQSSVGEGYLKQPTGIGYSASDEKIVVSDQENHCVWVITPEGDIINVIGGEKGSRLGMLNGPYGVAVTGDGKVVISEKGNSRLSVFSLQGSHIFSFGCKGSNPGQFNQLRHVCTNFNKQILVADEMNQRVQIFDI